jgi:hypothetical protein
MPSEVSELRIPSDDRKNASPPPLAIWPENGFILPTRARNLGISPLCARFSCRVLSSDTSLWSALPAHSVLQSEACLLPSREGEAGAGQRVFKGERDREDNTRTSAPPRAMMPPRTGRSCGAMRPYSNRGAYTSSISTVPLTHETERLSGNLTGEHNRLSARYS